MRRLLSGLFVAAAALVTAIPVLAAADGVALKSHKKAVDAVAISPDGKVIASAGDDGSVLVWDGDKVTATRDGDGTAIEAIAFSPSGALIALGTMYGQVAVWDRTSNKAVFDVKGHDGRVARIAFLPDGKSLLTASWDHDIKLWDATTGKELGKLAGHKYNVHGLVVSADGKQLFSCDAGGNVSRWDVKTRKAGTSYTPNKAECHALALSADGKTLAAGYSDGVVVFVDPATGKEQRRAKVADSVNALAFAGDGKLVVGTQAEELQIVDVAGAVTARKGHDRPITAVAADGKRTVTGSMDMTVRVWTP